MAARETDIKLKKTDIYGIEIYDRVKVEVYDKSRSRKRKWQ
jgi:hypothetical protein